MSDQQAIERPSDDSALVDLAVSLGATAAAFIQSREILVRESLAALCEKPGCPNYGLATSCPPHVSGPAGFRELIGQHPRAFVFKIDVHADVLLSPEAADLLRLVQEIGTAVERRALALGRTQARAYAGGCCKKLWCGKASDCRVVDRGGECRFPDKARHSMSGYGVDTSALLRTAGMVLERVDPTTKPAPDSTGTVCGLVLLG